MVDDNVILEDNDIKYFVGDHSLDSYIYNDNTGEYDEHCLPREDKHPESYEDGEVFHRPPCCFEH